jgi:protein-S-isoprenylcysteine O-methyltransferase Ste14
MNILPIYLISISLMIVAAMVVLRVFVRRDYMQRGCLSVRSSALLTLVFFAGGGFPSIYLPGDWPVSGVNLPLRVIGLGLGILRSIGLQTGVLKETNFYRVSRNPQVLGCVLYVIGFVILWPSWYAMGWGLGLIFVMHIMVLTEEEHLLNTYGQDYEQYCKEVPRYLGFSRGR